MRRRDVVLALPVLLACTVGVGAAHGLHTEADAIQLVDRAVDYVRGHARAEAMAAFSDPHGAFRDADLYLYVLDAGDDRLVMLAHGANPGLIGMPQRDIVDADGKDFNAETLRLTQDGTPGWIDYVWPNPVTRKIEAKRSYVRRVGDLIIGAGIYR